MDPSSARSSGVALAPDSFDQTQEVIAGGVGIVGLYFAYKSARAKVDNLAKISGSTEFLKFFGRAILRGYETSSNPVEPMQSQQPKDQKPKPWYEFLHRLPRLPSYVVSATFAQGVFSGFEDTVLGKVQDDIVAALFSWSNHKERIKRTFGNALDVRMKKIRDAEDRLVHGAFTGDDFTHLAGKNIGAIGRRSRAIAVGNSEYAPRFFYAYRFIDDIPAVCSAGASVIFVEIDAVGRALGSGLAMLSKRCFGTTATHFLSKRIITPLLVISHLYMEMNELLVDYVWGATNKVWDTIFYPVASGIMMGIYEAIQKASSSAQEILKQIDADVATITTPTEHQTSEAIARKFWKSVHSTWKICWDSAKKYFDKYDKMAERGGIERALVENATASKRILLGRQAFLQATGIESADTASLKRPSPRYAAFKGSIIIALRFGRALALSAQMFASKEIFSIIKAITKGITTATIEVVHANRAIKLAAHLGDKLKEVPVQSESPTGSVVLHLESEESEHLGSPTTSVIMSQDQDALVSPSKSLGTEASSPKIVQHGNNDD